jgi:glycosyltransferase involved in cell wall biosynthesis
MRAEDIYIQRGGVPGPAESRNFGMKFVTGDYFIFLDDDDTFHKSFFSDIARYLSKQTDSCHVYYTNCQVINEQFEGENCKHISVQDVDIGAQEVKSVYVKNYIPNNCLIYPKEIALKVTFDTLLPYEDWDFILAAIALKSAKHLPILGPEIHKNIDDDWVQRGKANNDKLLECYLRIYTKHTPPDETVAKMRKEFFASIGLNIEDLISNHSSRQPSIEPRLPVDLLMQFDALRAGIIFAFWLGPYAMSPSRSAAVHSIFRDSGRPVCFITDATLAQWELPQYPFHPAFRYLSEVHRADYLRCYLMHHYGGGYTDVKPVIKPWNEHFQVFAESDCLALGYPEISANAVAQLPGELGEQLRLHYTELIGYCSMIFRRRSILTMEWIDATHRKLDAMLPMLKAHPAQHPMDQLGATLPTGVISEYPLSWTEIGGNIFHPIIFKYRKSVTKVQDIMPQLTNYR